VRASRVSSFVLGKRTVRIPLDYYRILGVPIQAADQQLSQAYHDRVLQLPRREYSDAAVNARKQLLDEAYAVLSNSEKRSEYDANFLAKTYELGARSQSLPEGLSPAPVKTATTELPRTPWIEIGNEQFVGALLILHELGEYELVLKLGRPLLNEPEHLTPEQSRIVNAQFARADIVLALALSCLELGREQWQQGQSEKAATTGQLGQELLLREGLFPNVRGEIQADLYRLRPYRILELLAADEKEEIQRRRGLHLLRDMLQERGGIDGQGDDQSGLTVDDFLRFVQQIRSYLTAAEQQELFELEARRPSAVAAYLAIYALIARGFAQRQPEAIARAQELLAPLGRRQDVHLEQAICALLLGQTEAANRDLELSQEYEPLAFIREHSQGSPDLLPGLCLYAERWLQNEVFPHFRDLRDCPAALRDYFADERVQRYLEQLPGAAEEREPLATGSPTAVQAAQTLGTERSLPRAGAAVAAPEAKSAADLAANNSTAAAGELAAPSCGSPAWRDRPDSEAGDPLALSPRRRRRPSSSPAKQTRLILLVLAGILGLILVGWLLAQAYGLVRSLFVGAPETAITPELDEPMLDVPLETPSPEATSPTASDGPLDEAIAQQVVETWLATKSQAFGADRQIDQLDQILAEPLLSTWRARATEAQQEGVVREYEHAVEVEALNVDLNNPNRAVVEAAVREKATAYRNGQPDVANSYDDNLLVRYNLIRQDNRWQIEDMQLLQ